MSVVVGRGGGCWFKSDIKFVEFCGRESGPACYLLKSLPALRMVLSSVIQPCVCVCVRAVPAAECALIGRYIFD